MTSTVMTVYYVNNPQTHFEGFLQIFFSQSQSKKMFFSLNAMFNSSSFNYLNVTLNFLIINLIKRDLLLKCNVGDKKKQKGRKKKAKNSRNEEETIT